MGQKEKELLILIVIALVGQLLLKLWSKFGNTIHKINDKYFHDRNGLEDFYFSVYFLIYAMSLGIVYFYTTLIFSINYYILLVLLFVIIISFLTYKRINPVLTKIISDENCFAQSKRFFGRNQEQIRNLHFFSNTFYQYSLFINSIIALTVYLYA